MISTASFLRAMRISTAAIVLAGGCATAANAFAPRFDAVRDAIGPAPGDRGIAAYAGVHHGAFRDLGRYPAGAPVHIGLLLRYQHEAELAQLTYLQGERGSAYYHKYLTKQQWRQYFAPSPSIVARIARVMEERGFRVTRMLPNRTILEMTGTAAATERAFHTQLHGFYQAETRKTGYVNVTPAIMPAELTGAVTSVAGLHTNDVAKLPLMASRAYRRARSAALLAQRSSVFGFARELAMLPRAAVTRRAPAVTAAAATPLPISTTEPAAGTDPNIPGGMTDVSMGTSATSGYGPFAFAASYDEPDEHGYDGKGENVGNVISGDVADSDIKQQETEFGITATGTRTRIPVDVYYVKAAGNSGDDNVGESTLDAEAILGLAPGANYYEYLINTLADLPIEDGYNRVVSDDNVGDVNSSFGGCETDDPSWGFAVNYIAMQGAALGITFHASTGDTGGNGCEGVTNGAPGAIKGSAFPDNGYYFTAVGGTDLVANPLTGVRTAETGWETGGGGVSTINAMPSWQTAVVSAGLTPVLTGRNTPDVAFDASIETGYDVVLGGSDEAIGGTSLSSPIFAATQTMINEVQGTRHGWVNPRLYEIYAAQSAGYAFYDETAGTNEDYAAGPGYDNVTGLGSIQGFEMAGEE